MHRAFALALLAAATAGCAPLPPVTGWMPGAVQYQNPAMVSVNNPEWVWENVVDVVDDYFRIQREEPVRVVGGVVTEGRLDTFPNDAPTLLEPWRPASGNPYTKVHNTLQSTRHRAIVRVMPAECGFWIDVAVFRELEDMPRPAQASAGAATFRNDDSLNRVEEPVGELEAIEGWIPIGRDAALEQRIIERILARSGGRR